MQIGWFWLVVGLLPYSIKQQRMKDGQVLSVHACFWRITIRWRQGKCSWVVSVPLITHLMS